MEILTPILGKVDGKDMARVQLGPWRLRLPLFEDVGMEKKAERDPLL